MKRIKADWISGVLIGIFLSIQAVAMYLSRGIVRTASKASSGSTPSTEVSQATALLSAGEIILIAAVEIGLILLLYRGYLRLPEKWQYRVRKAIKYTLYSVLYVIGFLVAYAFRAEYLYLFGLPVAYAVFRVAKVMLSSHGLKWIVFNLIAICMGIFIVLVGGLNLAPRLAIVVMVAFLVYDHIAVHLTNIMSDFVSLSSSTRFPNFLIVPTQLRIDLERVHAYIQGQKDEKPQELAVMIGLGDFIFPSILVVSVFVAADAAVTVPVITTIAGLCLSVFVLRASLEKAESGLPALPYLNSGAIIGYVVGLGVTVLVPLA
jgi:presenilin-like A22 family membrane protease